MAFNSHREINANSGKLPASLGGVATLAWLFKVWSDGNGLLLPPPYNRGLYFGAWGPLFTLNQHSLAGKALKYIPDQHG